VKINSAYLFLICLLAVALPATSQTPGYMGKRFAAGYGVYASPGFYGSGGLTSVNVLHEGFLEFAAKHKFSLGFSFKIYKALNKNETTTFTTYNSGTPTGQIDLKARNFALYGKFYKRGTLAPWGKYFLLGASVNTFKGSYDPTLMRIPNVNHSKFGDQEERYFTFDVMFGNGRSRIIANRIMIDYGYSVGVWGVTSFLAGDILGALDSRNAVRASDYLETTGKWRINEVNRFNIFLKVGYLF
jgi:hypothetical protein